MRLVLASGSPRRAEILQRLGLAFATALPDIDETRLPDEAPGVYVERLARDKALAVASPDAVVVAADTAVIHEGHILGKPAHPQEARSMLSRLQGDVHEVFTGLAVAMGDELRALVDVTEVRMLPMTAEEIAGYVDTGEPMDKAGAYALQERGGLWVEAITGSPFTVIGLPVHLLPRLVAQVGSNLDDFFGPSNLSG
ncbi:MAG TPA: Maf family protein [Acidimicrobiia bacterium]|nr:Maf family protein [Acidimicrobiia bacterium]